MRKRRKIVNGARYHVTARANRGEFIFNSKRIKELFLKTVKRARKKYKFSITTFCIMSNHVHFIIQPMKNHSLSRIAQWILATFAINFNIIFHLKGHVWYDRFHSWVINNFREFLQTFIYITDNPVKAGITKNPTDYKYNGIIQLKKGFYDILDPPHMALKLAGLGVEPLLLTN
ncbi:MAG: transposase [Spirochaetales bacterium]|nr:transposase [Spirochaetales bacterium]